MDLKWQLHFMRSCTCSKTDCKENLTQEHSEVVQSKSSSTTQKFMWHSSAKNPDAYLTVHPHEPRWRSWWTQQHSEVFSRTQQHSEVYQFCPEFKCKLVGPMTRGTRPVDTLQRLQRFKKLYIRDQGLSITYTFAKHTRKQHKSVWSFSKNIDHHKDSKKSSKCTSIFLLSF